MGWTYFVRTLRITARATCRRGVSFALALLPIFSVANSHPTNQALDVDVARPVIVQLQSAVGHQMEPSGQSSNQIRVWRDIRVFRQGIRAQAEDYRKKRNQAASQRC